MTSGTLLPAQLRLPFDARLTMPGSKSHANRAVITACLSDGKTVIENATPCDDVALLVENLRTMGFAIKYTNREQGELTIHGGIPNTVRRKTITLDCGNAGTTLRFLTALCCIVPGSYCITGNAHMQKRPIGELVQALRELGADIHDTNGCPPVYVGDSVMTGGTTNLDCSKSSQFLSALLLIESALPKRLRINMSGEQVSKPYIALTKKVLRDLAEKPRRYVIEGDHSAAGAFLVLAELTHSRVRFSNLTTNSVQGDAKVQSAITAMRKRGHVHIDCTDMPDQVMNLAVLAAFRNGKTTLTGVKNLRYKECDRIAVLRSELSKVGVVVKEHKDSLTITGPTVLKRATLDPHDDHRMAFCFAILALLHGDIRIQNSGCVSKSYPSFFNDLAHLHHSPRPIAIVGMRGAGKSTFGKRLASALKLKNVDTDQVFVQAHGNLSSFIDTKGFKEFRKEEERIVQQCLQPCSVVALGGGAIESKQTRELLKNEALVIYLKACTSKIIERVRGSDRPRLTRLPLEKEVPLVLKKRTPLYESVATISFDESQTTEDALRSLSSLCTL